MLFFLLACSEPKVEDTSEEPVAEPSGEASTEPSGEPSGEASGEPTSEPGSEAFQPSEDLYVFKNEAGDSTVSYSGQIARHALISSQKAYMSGLGASITDGL